MTANKSPPIEEIHSVTEQTLRSREKGENKENKVRRSVV
jgi:hypothetical protein